MRRPPRSGSSARAPWREALARGFVAGGVASFDAISCSNGGDAERLARWRSLGASPARPTPTSSRAATSSSSRSSRTSSPASSPRSPHVHPARHLLVSVAAGVSADFIESELADARARLGAESETNPAPIRVVRVMPNTPCLVGAAASAASVGSASTPADLDLVLRLMRGAGTCDVVEERLMDAVVGVSGSRPGVRVSIHRGDGGRRRRGGVTARDGAGARRADRHGRGEDGVGDGGTPGGAQR